MSFPFESERMVRQREPTADVENELEVAERRRIKQMIDELGIEFSVEDYPELWTALVEMGSHFDDSICMAREIEALWDKLELRGITRQQMMLCAVLHDVGKAGPDMKSASLRSAMKHLFAPPTKPFQPMVREGNEVRPKTVDDFLQETESARAQEIRRVLQTELGVDTRTKSILEFWRDHAKWTYALLMQSCKDGGVVTKDLAIIASTHHVLEGYNPAALPLDDIHPGSKTLELMDKYQALAMVDKYQAFRRRSGFDHDAAIRSLREMVQKNERLNATSKKEYDRIIDTLDASKEELAQTLVG